MEHTGTVILHTNRLQLRPFSPGDAAVLFDRLTGDAPGAYALGWQVHADAAETQAMLAQWQKEYENLLFYTWAVTGPDGESLIGMVQLHGVEKGKKDCELGFWMGRDFRGQGYTAEAVRAVLELALGTVGFGEVCALHFCGNAGAEGVLQKIGMRKRGLLPGYVCTVDGRIEDCVLWSKTAGKRRL